MNTAQNPLFSISEKPLLFSAIGCIWGSFHEDNEQEENSLLRGILKTKDDREFRAYVRRRT